MRKVSIVKIDKKFQITIVTSRTSTLDMVAWCEHLNINKHIKDISIKLRRESKMVARRFGRKPRPYLVVFFSRKKDFLKFKKEWLSFDK
jgi:hypothetical protein